MSDVTVMQWASAVLRLLATTVQEYDPMAPPNIAALITEIIAIASPHQPWYDYINHIMPRQVRSEANMIVTEDISEATQRLHLRSPDKYYKHFCHVCHREWMGNPEREGQTDYTFPEKCRYPDCRSAVWNKPLEGASKRILWLARNAPRETWMAQCGEKNISVSG